MSDSKRIKLIRSERDELQKKINKLDIFLEKYHVLKSSDLLICQHDIMNKYLDILNLRLQQQWI